MNELTLKTLTAGDAHLEKGVYGGNVSGLDPHTCTANCTLTSATHSTVRGKYVSVQGDGVTVTLPAVLIGASFLIVNENADGEGLMTIAVNASDKFLTDIAGAAGANNKDAINTKATQKKGDFIKVTGMTADGWLIEELRGTWVDEA